MKGRGSRAVGSGVDRAENVMKAWKVERHGGPEALRLLEVPTPSPGPGQVRVRVEAVGLNHLDVWVRRGVPGHRFPLPLTPGCDSAGTVDALGPGTESIAIGTPVVVSPGVSCGRCKACLGGFDPICPEYGIFGETRDGGCAEQVIAPLANIVTRPAGLSAVDAASLPIPFLTAWTMLTRKTRLRAGETILIQAGGSGVSVAAIQMAKLMGATVITTVSSEEKAAKARALGADHVINYGNAPFRGELGKILKALGKKGVEVAIDHVGADTFNDSLKSLAWGGRLATCGATTGAEVAIDLKLVFFKNLSILGSTMGSKADFIQVIELVASKRLRPVIDRVMPMDRLPEALSLLENRGIFGKIVLAR